MAHVLEIEFEGIPGHFAAGEVFLTGQGTGRDLEKSTQRFDLGPIAPVRGDFLDRPGSRRMRARLTADADRGWAHPDIRSLWPGTVETNWIDVEIVRR
jgi:hypothetical protein